MAKTLFITGASSGIGAATARAAIDDGWNVGLFARSQAKLDTLADELGPKAMALVGDATNHAAQADAISALIERFGQLDAAFANAGRGADTPGTQQGNPEEWQQMVDLNIMGVLNTAHATLPHLQKVKGQFVVTGSLAGRTHIKGSVYSATKWFVHGFAGNLAAEMADWGGRCMVVSPGMADTGFFDSAKPDALRPDDVAASVLHALNAPAHVSIREIHLVPVN